MKKRINITHPKASNTFQRDLCEVLDKVLTSAMQDGKLHIPLALSNCIQECVSQGVPLQEITFSSKICYEKTSLVVNKLRQLISFLFEITLKEPTEVFANVYETHR